MDNFLVRDDLASVVFERLKHSIDIKKAWHATNNVQAYRIIKSSTLYRLFTCITYQYSLPQFIDALQNHVASHKHYGINVSNTCFDYLFADRLDQSDIPSVFCVLAATVIKEAHRMKRYQSINLARFLYRDGAVGAEINFFCGGIKNQTIVTFTPHNNINITFTCYGHSKELQRVFATGDYKEFARTFSNFITNFKIFDKATLIKFMRAYLLRMDKNNNYFLV